MKKILLLTLSTIMMFVSHAQKSYDKQWQDIDTLIYKNDLQKQALQKVISLGQQAKTEKNDPQYIKSLIYQTYLQERLSEEDRSENIALYQKAITEASEPAKSIVQSLLAEEYWRIYQYDKWKIYQRTSTTNAPSNDVNTWTIKDFHQKMSALFLASVHNSSALQKISIKEINPIIRNGNTDELRPTVYDLLAHRALTYFSTSDAYVTQPSDAFTINQNEAFAPAAVFAKYNFSTTDSTSLLWKALKLYQQLLIFHADRRLKLGVDRTDAILDIELQRIKFVYNNSSMQNKDELYETALKQIIEIYRYSRDNDVAEAYAMLASLYGDKANTYKPFGDSTYRWYYVKAKELCEKAIKTYKPSYGRTNCEGILTTISRPATSLQIEMVNIPQQPFRALLTYHNISNINCRIIRIDQNSSYKNINGYDTAVWKKLLKENPIKQWQQAIPNPLDYQQHKTEIPIEGLNEGNYILITSINNQFNNGEDNKINATSFYVSNISYIRNGNDFFILNRNTGAPLINASVQVYQQYYNYKTYKYETKKGPLLFADQQGHINVPYNNNEDRSITLDIRYKNDRLFLDNTEYLSQSVGYEYSVYEQMYFFTDRSIYRPGQTIYFKGVLLSKNRYAEPAKISTNKEVIINLQNANGEIKSTLQLTTNAYGSVNGQFTIPQGSLAGRWYLTCANILSAKYFSVEEYKRPSFYIGFDKPTKPYKLNDSVTIKGNVMAYAGYALSNAKVKYSISRKSRFFYPWYAEWYGYYPNAGKKQIADGNIETEADGSFKINFKATADKINTATRSQLFTFTIEVDITDLSGETHHQSFALPLSQQALQIDIPIANKSIVTADSLSHVMLSTKNLWGEPQASNIKVELIPIKETNRLLRQRYWDRPDQFVLSYDQYIQQFPNDIYNNENEPTAWAKQKSVYEEIIPSAQKLNKLSNVSPGWYVLKTSTKDTFNNTVENQIYVQVYDPNAKQLPTTTYWWQPEQNITINVNNTLHVLQGSSADNINLINLNIDNLKVDQNTIPFTHATLSNTIQTITKSITAENQGGMVFSQAFVKHNRFYHSKTYIHVPYQNTNLDIQYKTFRDKIEPGSKETWTVQIKTAKGNNTDAEVLTSMYDASLDQFIPHQWSTPDVWPRIYDRRNWSAEAGFNTLYAIPKYIPEKSIPYYSKIYSTLFSFNGFFNGYVNVHYFDRGYDYDYRLKDGEFALQGKLSGVRVQKAVATEMLERDETKKEPNTAPVVSTTEKNRNDQDNKPEQKQYNGGGDGTVSLRKHFNETAFFYPNLYTDNNGMVQFSFTIPEALTRWKWQVFAHNKDLATGVAEKNIITQKTLMVQPNWPRFMREGDKVELAIKVVNVSANEIKGQASLQLLDASTLQPVDIAFHNTASNQNFSVTAQQSTVVHFSFDLPYNYNKPLILRAIAKADKYSDGEEVMLPVLSSRILVTESVPLNMRKYGEKTFTLPTLLNMNTSNTLTPLNVSVEFSTNPVWYALQALPYLIEYPHECAEQTFNRLYAHAVASSIVRQNPNIANVLQQWSKDSSALMSNLQKNQELKSALLEETPWVQDAADETTQKKWIAQLVDTTHATQEVLRIISQLQQLQSSNGGFMWFKGGPDDPYITQYILTGISRLKRMNAIPEAAQQALDQITKDALQYADYRIVEYVNELKKHKVKEDMFDPLAIQYVYMRSGFQEMSMDTKTKAAHKYLLDNAAKYWKNYNLFGRGQLAIALFRNNKTKEATNILASAKDNAINNEAMGMYWKENIYGYYWYQSPIETQAILIEAFQEIEKNNATVNDLKTWLLQQKQTQRWPTTVSTADACYALLLSGSNWLTQQQTATISLGNTILNSNDQKTEAGTAYFKKSFSADNIKSDMGRIKVSLSSSFGRGREDAAAPAWGAVYWQYLEDMNKIPVVGNGLQIKKQLYKEIVTKAGKQLQPIKKESTVKVGDKIIVRLEMHSDRNLEYVHLKDLRASNTEPLNVLSQYKYQDRLGYYESTKDMGTNFFFNYLPKGTYVFEYPLFVNHAGSYSTGVATIQCMYAPVFNSHSDAFVIKAIN